MRSFSSLLNFYTFVRRHCPHDWLFKSLIYLELLLQNHSTREISRGHFTHAEGIFPIAILRGEHRSLIASGDGDATTYTGNRTLNSFSHSWGVRNPGFQGQLHH